MSSQGLAAPLGGQHAVVTGAGRGTGAAAVALAGDGASVSLLGRDVAGLQRLPEGLGGADRACKRQRAEHHSGRRRSRAEHHSGRRRSRSS